MRLEDDDFTLFGVPQRFEQDAADIESRWRTLQAQVHPDRFAVQGAAAQRLAMQWAVRVNEAHSRLRDPLRRGIYLCELRGVPVAAQGTAAMAPEFLEQQMVWREALDEAKDEQALQALERQVVEAQNSLMQRMARLLDADGQPGQAADSARALMFLKRFRQDVERRLDDLLN